MQQTQISYQQTTTLAQSTLSSYQQTYKQTIIDRKAKVGTLTTERSKRSIGY